MSSMDGRGLGANDWTEMELKKRAYPVVTLDSAALQGRIAVESGDSTPVAGCSGPVPMVWAPRAARGALMRAVHRRRAHQCGRSRSRLGAPIRTLSFAKACTMLPLCAACSRLRETWPPMRLALARRASVPQPPGRARGLRAQLENRAFCYRLFCCEFVGCDRARQKKGAWV